VFVIALLHAIVYTFVQMAPYLMIGLACAGILHVVFKKEFILKHLGRNSIGATVKAALFGVPLPLCSCGVIPTAVSLRKSRASEGATISFLISTPQTGIDSIIATYGMLGPVFAVFRPVAAFLMGILGGIATAVLPGRKPAAAPQEDTTAQDCTVCARTDPHAHSVGEKVRSMLSYAFGEFLDDIALHLVIGIVISGIISALVPASFFQQYVGNVFAEMGLMILGGIPLYICATASIPIAMALMAKGVSAGAAFVFLAVGPATNAATVVLIRKTMGNRTVAVYLGSLAVLSVGAGLLLNHVYGFFDAGIPLPAGHGHSAHAPYSPIAIAASLIFLLLLCLSLLRTYLPGLYHAMALTRGISKTAPPTQYDTVADIQGMTCNHCAHHVKESIRAAGAQDVYVDLANKKAYIRGALDAETVKDAVATAGYTVTKIAHH
jgi:hypothetical protein